MPATPQERQKVKQLIEENLRTQNPYLELGNCSLDGTEPELALLAECTHLKTLFFCNEWEVYDTEKQEFIEHLSQNKGENNKLTQIPQYLPESLKDLVLAGGWDDKFEIQDISSLQGLQNLTSLDLSYNQIQDISLLKGLGNLKNLDLTWNRIQDISFLQGLENLTYLHLSYNQIQDISFLQDLQRLTYLDLSQNQIQDISFLKNLQRLYYLSLSNNQIQDISYLAQLQKLQILNLSSNQIRDISPLKQLNQLIRIYLSHNPIISPPICLVYLKSQEGQLADYLHFEELPFVDKIWQLINSDDKVNRLLASELALSQGWTEEQIKFYIKFRF